MKYHKQKKIQILTFVVMVVFAGLIPGTAFGKEFKIDTNHSAIGFGVKHIFSTVWGHFSQYDAKIVFDPNQLDNSMFDFTVKVKSINTFNGKRDNHLRSKDFFAADTYPAMKFTSQKIVHTEGNRYTVEGTLQLKDVKKKMQIPFAFHGTAPSPFNKAHIVAGFDTEFEINRLDFGVGNGKFKKMGVVDDLVRVMISVEAIGEK